MAGSGLVAYLRLGRYGDAGEISNSLLIGIFRLCLLPKISDTTSISNLSAFDLELEPLRISSDYLKPSCALIPIW
jgi:hypothetical protein